MPANEASNSPYIIRNYQPQDFDNYVRLSLSAERLEPTGRRISARAISERLGRPDYSPERDLFLVEIDGDIIGFMDIRAELAIGRVILDGWIDPEHRRRGLATRLFADATRRARELRVGVAHVSIMEDNLVAGEVLSRMGFSLVRRFLKLSLDMAEISGWDVESAAPGCRHLRAGEEAELTRIQNLTFAEHWGYHPNTVEEITYKTRRSDFSPEDVILAGEGGWAIGFCWVRAAGWGGATDDREGQIFMLGVDPAYRGRGIGKRLLLASLAYLKGKGLKAAGLFVDSENELALALYRSIGFEIQTSSLWYEKVIN